MRRPMALLLAVPMSLGGLVDGNVAAASDACPATSVARTDQQPSGNRLVRSCRGLSGNVRDHELPAPASWVVADPDDPGRSWLVATADGSILRVGEDQPHEVAALGSGEPPTAAREDDGALRIGGMRDGVGQLVLDPLPDGHAARSHGSLWTSLAGPTERYAHGVLGDALEASALVVGDDMGGQVRVELPEHEVVEGLSPMMVDLEGVPGVAALVTISTAKLGARLRLYDGVGRIVAESEPIGRGFRWLHQVGAGPTGPHGETEVIAVRTPHIGGIVEAYRLVGDRLERVASHAGYSSHRLGSPNLDMALLADVDADGRVDVVVPTDGMTALGLLTRSAEGFDTLGELPLGATLASNLAAAVDEDGRLHLAAATDDGRLRVFH